MTVKSAIKKAIIIFVILLAIGESWVIWEGGLKYLLPNTKTNFKEYSDFYKKVDNFYPQTLPATASNIKYYYYTGQMDKKSGLSYTIGEQELEALKEHYLSIYENNKSDDTYLYIFNESVSYEFIKQEGLDFIEKFLEKDIENYTILVYEKIKNRNINHISGVLYNESKQQVILFKFKDAY